MDSELFEKIVRLQMERCEIVLGLKAQEYAPVDRLANFRKAANLQEETLPQALAGMMAKHTVSVYDMCDSGQDYPLNVWIEKITDHMNYLILLRAIVTENQLNPMPPQEKSKGH